jgi:DNA-binding Lrp family transcriptional regulator
MLDVIDRQIAHVLTIEPRASFRTIADVAGISDQTASRRYRRLTESAGLRVLGVLDGSRLGWVNWFVRLQITPGSADAIAEALARRPDTRWVHLASAGTEIICVVEARTAEQRDALFLRGLPGSRRVVQISAHSILHNFTSKAWAGVTQALSAAQLEMLCSLGGTVLAGGATPPDPPDPGGTHPPRPPLGGPPAPQDPPDPGGTHPPRPPLGGPPAPRPAVGGHQDLRPPVGVVPEDGPLLAELARDGRTSNAALAAAINWHESTVRRRIDELRRAGLLHFEVDLDSRGFGVNMHATLWLSVEPSHLDEVGRAVAGHLEVPFAAATTGPTNLVVTALFRDTEHLYQYLTGQLASLPGVRSVETTPIIRTLKRTGSVH